MKVVVIGMLIEMPSLSRLAVVDPVTGRLNGRNIPARVVTAISEPTNNIRVIKGFLYAKPKRCLE